MEYELCSSARLSDALHTHPPPRPLPRYIKGALLPAFALALDIILEVQNCPEFLVLSL